MSQHLIENHIENILTFINPYSDFINCHMVNYFKDNLWINMIPQAVQNEINDIGADTAIDFYWKFWREIMTENLQKNDDCFKYLQQFLLQTKEHSIDNLKDAWLTVDEFYDKLNEFNIPDDDHRENLTLHIQDCMSQKKNHEVEITSKLIYRIHLYFKNLTNNNLTNKELFVIDAGDGKGYLSSRLAIEYKFKVLGVDANNSNSIGAVKRNVKLLKIWNNLTKTYTSENVMPSNYKTATHFITSDTNLTDLLANCNIFNSDNENINDFTNQPILLCGLHTCGNLSANCLKIYTENSQCKILCNIGCCYHLLTEQNKIQNEFFTKEKVPHRFTWNRSNNTAADDGVVVDNEIDYGFPLSKYLKERNVALGRNARMLSSQSIHRTIYENKLPNEMLFYRALLQILIEKYAPTSNQENTIQIGKIKNCKNFAEYVRKSAQRLNIVDLQNLTENDLNEFQEKFAIYQNQLAIYYLLRQSMASVIETLILFDRLLFLLESGMPNSVLVKLFNPIISPRCYAIVSMRE